jgi:hypothetical protein
VSEPSEFAAGGAGDRFQYGVASMIWEAVSVLGWSGVALWFVLSGGGHAWPLEGRAAIVVIALLPYAYLWRRVAGPVRLRVGTDTIVASYLASGDREWRLSALRTKGFSPLDMSRSVVQEDGSLAFRFWRSISEYSVLCRVLESRGARYDH